MAKGGVFQALGNLWRWTIWGLAGVLVVALWLGWSDRDAGPGDVTLAEGETADAPAAEMEAAAEDVAAEAADAGAEVEAAAEDVAEAGADVTETVAEEVAAVTEQAEEMASEAGAAVEAAAADVAAEAETVAEDVAEAAETAVETVEEGVAALADQAGGALGEARDALAGAVGQAEADLNIVPPSFSDIRVPGDDATYALVSAFQRDDGTIEVVSERSLDGQTTQTIRLVTCAPLAVGVIAEGESPRNDTPELERIPLGTATATIAALACGAMN
jgi:hypothetical protein